MLNNLYVMGERPTLMAWRERSSYHRGALFTSSKAPSDRDLLPTNHTFGHWLMVSLDKPRVTAEK